MERSIFGIVRIWNRLPQRLVEAPTVKDFQTALTDLVRSRCALELAQWELTLSPRCLLTSARETRFFDNCEYQ